MSTIDCFREQAERGHRLAKEILDYDLQRRLLDLVEEFERRAEEISQQQGRGERSSERPRLAVSITGEIAFLYEAVLELRAIATAAPKIAGELRRMAEELEDTADELARAQRDWLGKADTP